MEFNLFIGIDVSKKTLDYQIVERALKLQSFKSENSIKGIESFMEELKKIKSFDLEKTVFCMEYTGIYNFHLLNYLSGINAKIWLENPIHIKRSIGMVRGKNDKIDAERIAMFAYKNREEAKIWIPERKIIRLLKVLNGVRNRILKSIESFQVPIEELKNFEDKDIIKQICNTCKASIKNLKKDLKNVNSKIIELIKTDQRLSYLYEIISSVENVGPVIATAVIIETNEFKKINNAKKFACYTGIAPFEYSSGTSIKGKTRVSNLANKPLKTLLHMAALGSVSRPGEMKKYFDRKVNEGKNKMLVLNAIRNKIIHRIYACLKEDKLFIKC